MGLPTTLYGVIGFTMAIVFIIGISATDLYPSQTVYIQSSQENVMTRLNTSINLSQTQGTGDQGFWDGILNFLDFVKNLILLPLDVLLLMIDYMIMFVGLSGTIPAEFYVFFILISLSLVISIVKMIFLSGD